MLGLAITQHRRSLILRREAKPLRAIVDRAREILGDAGRLNENTGVWRDLPGGRQIEFTGCKDPGDEQKHKGRPHDFVAFDEADQFSEFQVRFLMGWLRTTVLGQRCRAVLTFNPPSTAEGQWLLRYFGPWLDRQHLRPAKPGELRWYAMVDNEEVERPDGQSFEHAGELVQPKSRTFIPARLSDNPFLMATDYGSQLQALPEPLRSQLLYGDFGAGVQDDEWQVIPTEWIQQAQARWVPGGGAAFPLEAIGVDVARGGIDKTVLSRRHGTWFALLEKHPGKSTPDGPAVASLVQRASLANREVVVNMDAIGVGASPFDFCRGAIRNLNPINFASATDRHDRSGKLRFVNLRAYAFWRMREALDPSNAERIALPPDPELLADLTAARWSLTLRGVQIESKEEIKKRIGRSPDCGDAVVLANLPATAIEVGIPPQGRGNAIAAAPEGVFGVPLHPPESGNVPEDISQSGGMGRPRDAFPAW